MTAKAAPLPTFSLEAAWRGLRTPTPSDLLFSVKATVAVAIALLIGFSQNLENPYWSALTIFVLVAQPQAGAIRSKSFFRLAGTILGGAAAILLAMAFASHVGVLLIATLATVLLFYYLRTLDRTPANYTWFSAAITAAVIGIVHVQQPQTIFPFATTRMAEIALGILVIWMVDSIAFPRAMTPAFLAAMAGWRDKAGSWAAAALDPGAGLDPESRWRRRRALRELTALLTQLDALGVQLPYDIVAVPPRRHDMRFVRLLVSRLIGHLAAANVWIEALRQWQGDRASGIETAAATVREWIAEQPAPGTNAILDHARRGEAIRATLESPEGADDSEARSRAAMIERLDELVLHWCRLDRTLHAVATGRRMSPELRRVAESARPVRSIDYLIGALDVLPLILALSTCATIWFLTAWTAGLNAMLFAFIVCGFIIGTPGAVRSAKGAFFWVTVAFIITFTYQFVLLPRVTTFPMLIGMIASFTIPLGMLLAMSPPFLLVLAFAFAFLGLQNAYAADFSSTLQSMVGSMAGCLFAIGALFLCEYDRPRLRARRLARAVDRDLVDAARMRRIPDEERLISLTVDRIAAYFAIVEFLPDDDPLQGIDLVGRLRVAINLAKVRREERSFGDAARDAIDALRGAIAVEYGKRAEPDRPALLLRVQAAYDALLVEERGERRRRGLAGLTGLRVALTPDPAFEARMRGEVE